MVKRPTQSVLIIGGAGFIGRALTTRLLAEGRQVHVLAREARSDPIDGATYHVGRMDEREFVFPLLGACSISCPRRLWHDARFILAYPHG